MKETNYYVIKKKAVPEVLLKVLEVQKLLDSKKAVSVLEATEMVGISRSSYYKYKDDIFPFYAGKKGRSITFVIEVDDQPGVMASILNIFALYKANILTIHQSIPIKYFMKKDNLVIFRSDDFTDKIKDIMTKTRYRAFPVVNTRGKYIGTVSRRNFMSIKKKQLILVDHNERSQAVDNIEEAEILEIQFIMVIL